MIFALPVDRVWVEDECSTSHKRTDKNKNEKYSFSYAPSPAAMDLRSFAWDANARPLTGLNTIFPAARDAVPSQNNPIAEPD